MPVQTSATGVIEGKRWGECIYCSTHTTHAVNDSAGVPLPVCLKCEANDSNPIEHDPEFEPGWRNVNHGARGKQKYLSAGINIKAMATHLGVSYMSVYKRVRNAERNGPEALRRLAESLATDGHRVVTRAEVTQVVPVLDRQTFALAYFTPKAAKVAKALETLSQLDKEAIRRWLALAESSTTAVESQPAE